MADNGIGGLGPRADIASVLQKMRALRAQTQAELQADLQSGVRETVATPAAQQSFSTLLRSAVDSVSELQNDASSKANDFVRGDNRDLVEVMIAQQKSSVAFQALTQVRNRMVSAYEDIMKMPI